MATFGHPRSAPMTIDRFIKLFLGDVF